MSGQGRDDDHRKAGDPGAAEAPAVSTDNESGLASGDSDAEAGDYGALDAGELADSIGAGTLRGNPEQQGIPAAPAPERLATSDADRERGEL